MVNRLIMSLVLFSLIGSGALVQGKALSEQPVGIQKEKKGLLKGTMTLEGYQSFLDNEAKTDPGALIAKKELAKLPKDKQDKVVYYLNHPEIMAKVLSTDVEPNSKKEFFNGDIVVTRETQTKIIEEEAPQKNQGVLASVLSIFETTRQAAPKKVYDMSVSDVKRYTFFGKVPQTTFNIWCKYKSDTTTVKSIITGDGSNRNYYPLVGISKDSSTTYIYGNKAHTAVIWKVSALNTCFASFNKNHHVLGFPDGTDTYRFFNS